MVGAGPHRSADAKLADGCVQEGRSRLHRQRGQSGTVPILLQAVEAGRLDVSLGETLKVPAPYTGVISLFRVMTGRPMPVNAPAGIQRVRDKYFSMNNAEL